MQQYKNLKVEKEVGKMENGKSNNIVIKIHFLGKIQTLSHKTMGN